METWDAITSRRNVREYAERPIPQDDLDRILEAGRRTPSSRNWQPWDFVLVTDGDRLTELANVWRGAAHVDGSGAGTGWFSDGFVKLGRYDAALQARLEPHQPANGQFYAAMALNAAVLGCSPEARDGLDAAPACRPRQAVVFSG